ncbi:DUF7096 domain-containing protein [Halobaculum lipolyticum]|uniref:Carboxypeptidase regulatory-like domain-containing protein n=1 Tax=Halobaculum lipolyticum TaxID=3032001 RepID=A0ABD5WCV3_9EURY|nr:hypothetical protein [Halobaculum sp. DT31]
MRTIPVILAALLVFASVGVGAPGAAIGAQPQQGGGDTDGPAGAVVATSDHNATEGIRVLSLNESGDVAADIDVVTIEAGTATEFAASGSATRIETMALRERIEAANTTDERQRRILDGLNEVEKDAITLHSRQQTAIEAYTSGTTTARELLVELARIRASAAVLSDRVRVLNDLAEDTDDFGIDETRVFALVYDLRTFDGPVRSRTAAALSGDQSASTRVYVAATGDGVSLATVADGRYIRETYRGDLRDRENTGIDQETAENVTRRSYPELWNATAGSGGGVGSGGVFILDLEYPNGTLTAFVGGGSERVFMEHQRIDLAGVDTGEQTTRTLDLTLRVNRTFPGGPLRVAVTDPATGEPVNAVVKVGRDGGESTDVGRTGDDGVLWTVSPRGEFVVTVVEVGSTDVSTVPVTPSEPTTVAAALEGANGSAQPEPGD